MCSGGSKTQSTPTSTPGVLGATKVPGDPSQAHLYIGKPPAADTSNRYGGELMTGQLTEDQAAEQRKLSLLGG